MIALDAYALVALLADEPARDDVVGILRRPPCVMSTVNLAEAFDILGRVHQIDDERVRSLVDPLLAVTIEVDSPPAEDAKRAASLRRRHYHRATCDLSLADCFLLATASRLDASVATADPAVAAVAREESLELIALPDSAGERP